MRESEILRNGSNACDRNRATRSARVALLLVACLVLLTSSGCPSMTVWRHKDPQLSRANPPLAADATPEDILARINQNAYSEYSPHGLKSYRDDRVKVRMRGVPAPMRASIVVEAPRCMRMRVANPLSGGEAVDLGSNDERFWFWAKESQPANVLVCSHDEISAASQVTDLPLPFRPDWLMEVLGVTPVSGSKYEIRRANRKSPIVELVSVQRTPDQQPVRRIVKVDLPRCVVLEHRVESMEGQMIAKAVLSRHFRDPQTRLILPRQISIDWPAADQQVSLSLEFTEVEFNAPPESVAMWEVPRMAGYPEVDIGAIAMQKLGRTRDEVSPPAAERNTVAGRIKLSDDIDQLEAPPAAGREEEEETSLLTQDGHWSDPQSLDTIVRPVRTASTQNEVEGFDPPQRGEESDPQDESSDVLLDSPDSEPPPSGTAPEARPFPQGM